MFPVLSANTLSGAYNINNSLRFRASASAYLNRTFTTPTNNKIFTLSSWVKRGALGAGQFELFTAGTSGSNYLTFQFGADKLNFISETPSLVLELRTTQVFRDPSAWYHIVLAVDTTQATSTNRVKIYVNGTQVTSFSTATYPAQNLNLLMNSAVANYFGYNLSGGGYYDGYLTEAHFVDGQALTPSSFGSTNATTGVWQPAKYTGTYGTNGFYLNFTSIALTSGSNTGLGKDNSGNGNYWNTNNISVTAGTTYDAMIDSPTLTSATVGNYAVANPLDKSTNVTVTNGNLTVSTAVTNAGIRGSMYVSSGKYYWEATCTTKTNYPNLGIADAAWGLTNVGSTSGSYGYATDGLKYNNGSTAAYGATYTNGDVIGVALDLDAGTLVFYKNNASQGTAYSSLSGTFAPAFAGQASDVWNVNFGQRPFSYTPPSGFVALNTYNLPTPTILQGNKYMDATLYTGTGSALTITNAGAFKPDFVWGKDRAQAQSHLLFDSVRGVHNFLSSNSTSAESTNSTTLTSFNSNGFGLGTNATLNQSGISFVGWQWQAGQGTTTAGTGTGGITSVTQSVSTTAGFSIVQFTASGSNGTVTHGLGVAPSVVIVKDAASAGNWAMYHKSLPSAAYYLYMNTTAAQGNSAQTWNSTAPTSSVFSIGTWHTADRQIAYCFAEIAGFSKFGSYTGNGSTDGVFVNLGFRPKFVLLKSSSTADDWYMHDSTRNTYNVVDLRLSPNLSSAEVQSAVTVLDFLSNGFKLRTSNGGWNGSGNTYIYMAFAENPFKNSNAR